jgi:hypothetical protein
MLQFHKYTLDMLVFIATIATLNICQNTQYVLFGW